MVNDFYSSERVQIKCELLMKDTLYIASRWGLSAFVWAECRARDFFCVELEIYIWGSLFGSKQPGHGTHKTALHGVSLNLYSTAFSLILTEISCLACQFESFLLHYAFQST